MSLKTWQHFKWYIWRRKKKTTPESICFCCWTKINSTKLKTEQRKAFWIHWMFCLLHNLVHTTWSRAGGWTRALLLRAVCTRPLLRGLCQFSGPDSWRDRSMLCGGTATVSISAQACLLCAIPCTCQRQVWTHLCGKWEPSERLSRVSRGSTLVGGLLSWLPDGERWRPEWLQHLGVHVVFWTSEQFFHLLSPPSHLDFHEVLSSSPVKLLKESWKETLSCPSWYCGQDKVRFLERPELTSYLSQKGEI